MKRVYFEDVLSVIKESIESVDENVYKDLIDECVRTLKNGGKIIASGLGKNVPICEKFVGTMNSMGLDARFLHTNTAMHGDLGVIRPEDLLILLSKSGNTRESVELAEHLLDRGTDMWLMTFSTECKLANICNKQLIMDLKNEGLFLTASNDEIAIETFIDSNNIVSIDEIGSIVVPGKYFLEIIRKIEDETVYIETDGLNTLITTKRGEYSLNGMSATEFPNIKLELVKNPIIINEKIIKNIVSQTSFAVSTQESRPVLTGINFKIENSTMECVATDSYRLAKKIITLDKDVENKINIVIPGRNLVELTKLLTDDEKFVEMHVFSNNVLFKSKDMLFQSRLLNNSYPDLSKLIPDEYELVLKLNLVEFYNTIDRVSLLTSEKDKNQVKMEINSDDIVLSSTSQEIGKIEETMHVSKSADKNMVIAFSSKYMMDALRTLKCDEVEIKLNSEIKPIIIKNAEDDNLIQIVVPIKTF